MSFRQLAGILLARGGTILMIAMLAAALAAGVMMVVPESYKATATVLVDPGAREQGAASGASAGSGGEVVTTHSDILSSTAVALRVVDGLSLEQRSDVPALLAEPGFGGAVRRMVRLVAPAEAERDPETLRTWLARRLLGNLEVRSSKESHVIAATYTAPDPAFAAAAANAFVEAYRETIRLLHVRPAQEDSQLYDQEVAKLKARLESAEEALTRFQQRKGIVATDERLDLETVRLNELSGQLAVAQARAHESAAKQRRLRDFLAGPGARAPAEVALSPVVQQLQQRVAEGEAKLSELAQRRGPKHPQRRAAEVELHQLRAELDQTTRRIARGFLESGGVASDQEAALGSAFQRQRSRVLELKSDRGRLAALEREVEDTRRAYNAAADRRAQSRIAGAAGRANTSIVHEAAVPIGPSGPSALFVVMSGFLGGLALGVGIALAREAVDGYVRSELDITEGLGVPVLSVLARSTVSRHTLRQLRTRRIHALPGP